MVGPELVFSIYAFVFVFCPRWVSTSGSSPTNITLVRLCGSGGETGGGAIWRVPGVYRSLPCEKHNGFLGELFP